MDLNNTYEGVYNTHLSKKQIQHTYLKYLKTYNNLLPS